MGAWGTPILGVQQLPWNRSAFTGKIELTALSREHNDEVVHYLAVFEHAPEPQFDDDGTLIQVCLGKDKIRTLREWCDEVLGESA